MTTREALAEAAAALDAAGCPSPRVDAEWLLAHVLGGTRTDLYTGDHELGAEAARRFQALVERRATREPLAYVLGEWGFRRLTLAVDRRVLIPRPETEVVVERCLSLLEGVGEPRVLDIGVGSGAIALAIADERPDASVVGTETSAEALGLAEENRRRVGVDGRVRFVRGDLVAGERGPFDLVVSNPPYVAPHELPSLEPEVRHEPAEALVGEGRHEGVARAALGALRPGGTLVLEVGGGQAAAVASVLGEAGYEQIRVSEDLGGVERVVEGTRP